VDRVFAPTAAAQPDGGRRLELLKDHAGVRLTEVSNQLVLLSVDESFDLGYQRTKVVGGDSLKSPILFDGARAQAQIKD
jgi:hypothetical protein